MNSLFQSLSPSRDPAVNLFLGSIQNFVCSAGFSGWAIEILCWSLPMGMQGWITPSGKKSCCLLHRQEEDRLFFFNPLLPGFHSTHGEGKPLAFHCPAAPGMGDEETLPAGRRTVQDGLISLCFLTLRWCSTLWHHLSAQITFRMMSASAGESCCLWIQARHWGRLSPCIGTGDSKREESGSEMQENRGWWDSQRLLWIIVCLVGGLRGMGQGWILNTSGYLEWPKPEI